MFQVSLNFHLNQNTLYSAPQKLTKKTSLERKRATDDKHANSTKTKKNKLFNNHTSTKPFYNENVDENIDIISIEDDEESSDSAIICGKDRNQSIMQPLTSEVLTPSFDMSDDEQV